jgi:hypothetical protein
VRCKLICVNWSKLDYFVEILPAKGGHLQDQPALRR